MSQCIGAGTHSHGVLMGVCVCVLHVEIDGRDVTRTVLPILPSTCTATDQHTMLTSSIPARVCGCVMMSKSPVHNNVVSITVLVIVFYKAITVLVIATPPVDD